MNSTPIIVSKESMEHISSMEDVTERDNRECSQGNSTHADSSQASPRIDEISNLPITLTNLAYNYFLPQESISRSITDQIRNRIKSRLELEYAGTTDIDYELCGSLMESLSVPHFYPKFGGRSFERVLDEVESADIDIMKVVKHRKALLIEDMPEVKTGCYAIRSEGTHVGYLRLQIMDIDATHISYRTELDGKWYMSSENIKSDMKKEFLKRYDDTRGLDIHIQGPSLQILELEKFRRATLDSDNVLSIPCPKWPTIAVDFKTRPRTSGWPDKDLIDSITEDGCLIVPMSHPHSLRPDLDWRYSFSVAERRLVDTLSNVQRQCYILMKIFRKACLVDFKDIVQSYHLKTLLLWECETQSEELWMDENLSVCFFHLLDQLHIAVKDQKLSHYFIPDNNLFDRITESETIAHIVEDARLHPLKFIFNFSSMFNFIHIPNLVDMDLLLNPIISASKEHKLICADDIKNIMCSVHYNFGMAFMLEPKADLSVESFMKGIACLLGRKDDAVTLEQMLVISNICAQRAKTPITVFKFIEQVIRKVPGADTSVPLLDILGCAYHAYMLTADDDVQKEHFKQQASNTYNRIISGNISDGTVLDFGNFLYDIADYDKAIGVLSGIIETNSIKSSHNIFFTWEMFSIDKCLTEEIEKDGSIVISSYAFALYLLAFSYFSKDMTNESERYTCMLVTFAKDYTPTEKKLFFPVYTLLGRLHRKLNQIENACKWFEQAIDIVPGNRAVSEELTVLKRGSILKSLFIFDLSLSNIKRRLSMLARALINLNEFVIRWRL